MTILKRCFPKAAQRRAELGSKNSRYDYIEEIQKFNPYHDERGRFTTASGATSFTYSPGKSKAHNLAIQREKDKWSAGKAKAFEQVKNNPYIHTNLNSLWEKLGQANQELQRASLKADLEPSSATNRVIAANKAKVERLGKKIDMMMQAAFYLESWGGDDIAPF